MGALCMTRNWRWRATSFPPYGLLIKKVPLCESMSAARKSDRIEIVRFRSLGSTLALVIVLANVYVSPIDFGRTTGPLRFDEIERAFRTPPNFE